MTKRFKNLIAGAVAVIVAIFRPKEIVAAMDKAMFMSLQQTALPATGTNAPTVSTQITTFNSTASPTKHSALTTRAPISRTYSSTFAPHSNDTTKGSVAVAIVGFGMLSLCCVGGVKLRAAVQRKKRQIEMRALADRPQIFADETNMTCPINFEELANPVISPAGTTYENVSIREWLATVDDIRADNLRAGNPRAGNPRSDPRGNPTLKVSQLRKNQVISDLLAFGKKLHKEKNGALISYADIKDFPGFYASPGKPFVEPYVNHRGITVEKPANGDIKNLYPNLLLKELITKCCAPSLELNIIVVNNINDERYAINTARVSPNFHG